MYLGTIWEVFVIVIWLKVFGSIVSGDQPMFEFLPTSRICIFSTVWGGFRDGFEINYLLCFLINH